MTPSHPVGSREEPAGARVRQVGSHRLKLRELRPGVLQPWSLREAPQEEGMDDGRDRSTGLGTLVA